MNPAGVVFGADASMDVRGSFAVTTADYLKLADGERFDARVDGGGGGSVLTSAAPAGFGFLGPQRPAGIEVRGEALVGDDFMAQYHPTLTAAPGRALVVVGGDVTVRGGRLAASASGPAAVVAVASAGEVRIRPGPPGGVPPYLGRTARAVR